MLGQLFYYGGLDLLQTISSKHIYMGKVQNFNGQTQISIAITARFRYQHMFSLSKYVTLWQTYFHRQSATFSWAMQSTMFSWAN